MKRRLRRILILALVLVLIAAGFAVAVQVVLSGDLPRRLVAEQLEKQTGFRVKLDAVEAGWGRSTTLRGLALSLPLAEGPLFEAPRIDATHAMLLSIILWRDLDLSAATVHDPALTLRQDAAGRWNALDAFDLIRQRRAASASPSRSGSRGVKLPGLLMKDLTIRIVERDGAESTLAGVTFRGEPQAANVWRIEAALDPRNRVTGKLLGGGRWQHELDLSFDNAAPLLRPFIRGDPGTLRLVGAWAGKFEGGTLRGRLDLREAEARGVRLTGSTAVDLAGGTVTVRPKSLTVAAVVGGTAARQPTTGAGTRPATSPALGDGGSHATLTAGTLVYAGGALKIEDLHVRRLAGPFFGGDRGEVIVSGAVEPASQTGELHASWAGLTAPGVAEHSGELRLTLAQPRAGWRAVRAELLSTGVAPGGRWDAKLTAEGEGAAWTDTRWSLAADHLAFVRGERRHELTGVTAEAGLRWPELVLTDLRATGGVPLTGAAEATFEEDRWRVKRWRLALEAGEVVLDPLDRTAVGLRVAMVGTPERIDLREVAVTHRLFEASAEGAFELDGRPQPLALEVVVTAKPPAATTRPAEGDEEITPGFETLTAKARVTGGVSPLRLTLDGGVTGERVRFGRFDLGKLSGPFRGAYADEVTEVNWHELDMLEGKWELKGRYDQRTRLAAFEVKADDFDLRHAAALLGREGDLRGRMDVGIKARLPGWDMDRLTAEGDWAVRAPAYKAFEADAIGGRVQLDRRVLTLPDVVLTRGAGRVTATASTRLGRWSRVRLDAKADGYPLHRAGDAVAARVSGQTELDLDLKERTGQGGFDFDAALSYAGRDAGTARLAGRLDGDTLRVERLGAAFLDGTAEGDATVALRDWTRSSADVRWKDLNVAAVKALLPGVKRLEGFEGVFSGWLRLGPDRDPRALGPMRLTARVEGAGARYRTVPLGAADVQAYLDRDRFVIDQCTIELAGGVADVWARASRRDGRRFYFLRTQFSSLDLQQIEQAINKDGKPVPGRITGAATLTWPADDRAHVFGQADVRVADSDFARVGVFALLYNAMNLSFTGDEPRGRGRIQARLEGSRLQVTDLRYANRGVNVRLTLSIEDIWKGGASPIDGYAVGTTRPLPELSLFKQLADAIDALQATATAMRIGGTWGDPKPLPVALDEVGSLLRAFLMGRE